MNTASSLRPAWIEIDLAQLRRNFALIQQDKPGSVGLLSVVKAQAYGHGAVAVARVAVESGAAFLGVATLGEALGLRTAGIAAPILLLGERLPEELPACVEHSLTVCLGDVRIARELDRLALATGTSATVHVKIDTGMSRYGFRWDTAAESVQSLAQLRGLRLEGLFSHFARSDEADKTFALQQLARFQDVVRPLAQRGIRIPLRHHCNTGGFLDLPQAHFDLVRLGILPLGVYPSQVCRRIPGLEPVMTVKARIAVVRDLQPGDTYGYGMRYRAETRRRIAVLPLGYGDGFPRLRNQGHVLVHGQRAPLIGGVAMDAMAADITSIPAAQAGDQVVIMGRQQTEIISAHDIAGWGNTVSYDVLAGWRARLPRELLENTVTP